MSVHNIVFPGAFPPETTQALGLPWEAFAMHGLEFYGRMAFLKAGLFYADHITTVSPSYAEEIKTEAYGGGLHGLLQSRAHELTGILNGIDTELWDPGTDSHLAAHYSRSNLEAKAGNKRALRSRLGLADQSHRPLLGMVSRLTAQKGADLIPEALAALDGRAFQLAILGSGDRAIEATLRDLAAKQPATIIFISSYDEGLAHQIEAGADVFLMPSRFEPCGLNQMYSMRYGTPPLVRRTGGLADTVVDVSEETLGDGTATGFVFESPKAQALGACIRRAVDLYQDEAAWRALQENGMRKDFSWTRSARRYKDVYKAVLARFGYHGALHPPTQPRASLRS
jgi:starch synthase